jgi:hypothetical protein
MFSGPLAAPPAGQTSGASALPPGETNIGQVASQGLSGINEGIAGTLGAPVDLVDGAIGKGADLINTIMGTNLKAPDAPFLGSKSIAGMMGGAGAITPPTSAPADQIARTIGQSVGGAIIPEAGLASDIGRLGLGAVAGQVARAVPGAVVPAAGAAAVAPAAVGGTMLDVAKGLGPAAASGLGGAVAQQVAPGNQGAQLAGELIGGVVPSTALSTARAIGGMGAELPTLEQLTAPDHNAGLIATKNAAYDNATNLGAQYSAQGFGDLTAKMAADATADGINPMRHPQAAAMLQQIGDLQQQGHAPTLTQLDQLRQVISRDVAKSSDAAEAHFGRQMLGNIDQFIANASPAQMASGTGPQAADAIQAARAANTRLSKTEAIDTAIQKAITQAGASGSGGNINNALRQQFKPFLNNPNMARGLTPEETRAIVKIVMGGPVENTLRTVGKMAPGGNGLMNQMNTASAVLSHGATLPIPIVGSVAKRLADGMTESKIANLRSAIATGQAPTPQPFYSPAQQAALASAGASAATNQNAQSIGDEIKAAVMRRRQ